MLSFTIRSTATISQEILSAKKPACHSLITILDFTVPGSFQQKLTCLQTNISSHSMNCLSKLLLMQTILQPLLISIIAANNGQALQVYPNRKPPSLYHVLHPRGEFAAGAEYIPPVDDKPPAPYECAPKPLVPQTWKDLRVDKYIKYYPRPLEVNLTTFASQNKALNLACGLNQFCSAGQLYSPIRGRAWWVLAAVEQFSFYENALYLAIAFAAGQAKGMPILWGLIFFQISLTTTKDK
ncbi:hypothetical protein PGT21_008619 [Puccinia graminis f. sp. tritici]|uniref:Uncharacterized protein n=1 Tax=Puccinia graminis f. sp. tritici TaxID=56615 RepID=A0A5B0S6Q7_PUCGR|nr:hypothetical protein PGT21_008619 [Puccinia graminis f. sp. tritici]KAA1133488.1 hypothetical protein PGTUg99_017325 [Puccinia graminis f. sp. tritici]